jgi:hypothetical protein
MSVSFRTDTTLSGSRDAEVGSPVAHNLEHLDCVQRERFSPQSLGLRV